MKQKYPHLLRVQNQSKPEIEVNLKENLQVTDKTHQKTKRQMNHIPMITPIIITIMIITLPQVRVKATDLLMAKTVPGNSEASHSKAEARDLSIIHVQFPSYRFQRGTYQSNHNQYSSHHKPYFQGNQSNSYRGRSRGHGPQQTRGRGCGRANYHNNNNYQYQFFPHDQQTEQYGPPCSLCRGFNHFPKHCYKGEHDINNLMEKMSINLHQQQQGNLYQ